MNIILFDDASHYRLLPFTHTRPVADIRCGIFTMRERWEFLWRSKTSTLTAPYLQQVFPLQKEVDNFLINAAAFATAALKNEIESLKENTVLLQGETIIAARVSVQPSFENLADTFSQLSKTDCKTSIDLLQNIWDIFSKNDKSIRDDFAMLTKNKISQPLPPTVIASGKENIFIEAGAKIAPCIINAETGPVYIGKDAEIWEGCMIRGPLALCEHSVLKMGTKVYGATTIGPGCKAGGEISNVVMFANSNKGHDGFIGNAVIGEWCNLGADTNCSNLKNNYGEVKIWDEYQNRSVKTGLQFCGLLMADHSKCAINTMFNTGTVVGVSANIYGGGFPEKFLPSFAWGGSERLTSYDFERAMETAARMMARRNKTISVAEKNMYREVFNHTQKQRDVFCVV